MKNDAVRMLEIIKGIDQILVDLRVATRGGNNVDIINCCLYCLVGGMHEKDLTGHKPPHAFWQRTWDFLKSEHVDIEAVKAGFDPEDNPRDYCCEQYSGYDLLAVVAKHLIPIPN